MTDRFNSYKDKYKKTHTLSLATGFGLTPEDQQTGIQEIKQKLDSLCPHYQAMHELMGNKDFVNPLYKVDAQKDVETTNSSDSDDSDNPDDSDNSDDSDDSNDSDDSDRGKGKDDSDNGKGKDSDIGELGDNDPEGQNMHTNPALDPDLLDYNPQNQQRPTTSPNDVLQQSSQRKRKRNTWYHQCRNALTAEERALDSSSSDGSSSSEVITPTKSPKKKKKKKKKAKVSPNANDLETHPSPSKTPQNTKGKQIESNSDNINPRSHSTPASKNNNAFAHYEEYALKREAGKAQVAQASLDFEINKYQHQLAIENKTVKLEEKKFMRLSKLEEKKWEQELKMDEKRLEWEKDEKAKDQTFELSKLGTLADKENLGKKYELVKQCVTSGKSTEEIERLAQLFQ
ncbi:hypothetical protein PCASD_03364 [Puccinia coronata f. sp. avenae]|uniref:No apical meristem-associated C-terminal domain-containing protein n=1 Tax=Puccinia coronata f. sp. avenae TaxID=200324 RepID=A0A2N5VF56_9BASI|nr:hypothetical protein PCASD_03364 [Puccinia coronata f. sp. avenae]